MTRIINAFSAAVVLLKARAVLAAILLCISACGQTLSPETYLQRAKDHIAAARYNEGIIELKNALQGDAELAEARWLLGDLYLKAGDGAAAQKELERAAALGYTTPDLELAILRSMLLQEDYTAVLLRAPDVDDADATADLLAMRGEARLGQGNPEEAAEAFNRALELNPDSISALLGSVRLAIGTGAFDQAGVYLEHLESIAPDRIELGLSRGALGLARNDPKAAEAGYTQALGVDAGNPTARLGLARALLGQGRNDEAETYINSINQQYPNNTAGNFLLGVLELQRGNRQPAKDALLQVVRADPAHLQALITLASIYYQDDQLEQAQSHIKLFQVAVSDYLPAQKLASAISMRLGNVDEAVSNLESVISQASNDAQFYSMLGSAYMSKGNVEKGTTYLSQAAELAPDQASIKTQLAMGKLSGGNIDQAIEDLESAVELDPELIQAEILLISVNLQKGDFNKALELATESIGKHPDNPVYYNLAGAAHLGLKNKSKALEMFNRAIELDPKFTPAMINLAQMDLQDGDSEAARQRFEAVVAINENNIQALVGLARLAQSRNDVETVARHLQKARLNNKYALEPRLMLANYYQQKGDIKMALEVIREARDVAPERAQVLGVLGQVESAAGNHDEAIKAFSTLATLLPDNADASYRLGIVQTAAGKHANANQSLQRARELDPDNPTIIGAQTSLAIREGKYDEALGLASILKEKHPDSPEGFAMEGDIHLASNQLEEAIRAYEKAYSVQKTSLLAIKLHGAYRSAGKTDEAYSILEKWLADNPGDPAVKSVLAGSRLQEGDNATAARLYNEVLQTNPDHVLSLNNLAWLMHQNGDPKALQLAERAYQLSPGLLNVIDTYAWILIEQDQVEQGLTLLQKAISGGVQQPSIRYHYASGLSRSGDTLRAISELETILAASDTFPEREAAQQLLDRLRAGK